MSFTREVTALHQIELTSRCNLRCQYCPSKDIADGKYPNRPSVDITDENFYAALRWVDYYVRKGTQGELNLAGIGESTMHPKFVEYLKAARAVLPNQKIVLATNGLIHDEEMVKAIAPFKPEVYVSMHRPEKAGPALSMYKRYGIAFGGTIDPALSPNDWAGQVKWESSGDRFGCPWIGYGWLFVMADGALGRCCVDASGIGKLGHVMTDAPGSISTAPYELCKSCYQIVPIENWNQKEGKFNHE